MDMALENVAISAPKTAIVVCADRGIFETLVGLLLSLQRIDRTKYRICLVDVGLTPDQRRHVEAMGVNVANVCEDFLVSPHPTIREMLDVRIPFWKAMLCRPFLRDYFPGFANYIHLDGDVWLQNTTLLDIAVELMDAGKAVIVPEADVAYPFLRSHSDNAAYIRERRKLIARFFDDEVADLSGALPYYNLGFYGLPGSSSHWERFANQLQAATRTTFHFLCEQIVLNIVLFETGTTHLLPATANWMCTMATPVRHNGGPWRSPVYPYPEIDLIHLSGTEKMERYAPLGLLYDDGRYLDEIAYLASPHAHVG